MMKWSKSSFGQLNIGDKFQFPETSYFYKPGNEYKKIGLNASVLINTGMGYVWGQNEVVEKLYLDDSDKP
jgi:hypothetical protein